LKPQPQVNTEEEVDLSEEVEVEEDELAPPPDDDSEDTFVEEDTDGGSGESEGLDEPDELNADESAEEKALFPVSDLESAQNEMDAENAPLDEKGNPIGYAAAEVLAAKKFLRLEGCNINISKIDLEKGFTIQINVMKGFDLIPLVNQIKHGNKATVVLYTLPNDFNPNQLEMLVPTGAKLMGENV